MTPSPIDPTKISRVLIVKLSAIGDILHALPVSAALKDSYPHWEISWAVEEPFVSLLQGNPTLKRLYAVPKINAKLLKNSEARKRYAQTLREIRAEAFDLVIDLQGLTKSALLVRASRAKARIGYHWQRELAKWTTPPAPKRPESVHIVDQYLDVARFLGAEPNPVRFPLVVPEADRAAVSALLLEGGITETPFVAINPASALAIKQWSAENYAHLMDALSERLGVPSVLTTADKNVAQAVANATKHPFLNLTGKTTLLQLAGVLERCAVHVCGDTGSGHIATAFGRPVVSLIGPTDPDRACPYGQRERVLVHREHCDPKCNWHHCAFSSPHCMEAITVEEAFEKVAEALAL